MSTIRSIVALSLCVITSAYCIADDSTAVRSLVDRYWDTIAEKDSAKHFKLWSGELHEIDSQKQRLKVLFDNSSPIAIKNREFVRTDVNGKKALVRMRFELVAEINDPDGKHFYSSGKQDFLFELAKVQDEWKIVRGFASEQAFGLVYGLATTKAERDWLCENYKDLVTIRAVQVILETAEMLQLYGHHQVVARVIDDALDLADRLKVPKVKAACLTSRAANHIFLDRIDAAITDATDAVRIAKTLGEKLLEAHAQDTLGCACLKGGIVPAAWTAHVRSLALFRELKDERGMAKSLLNASSVKLWTGEFGDALRLSGEALQIVGDIKEKPTGERDRFNRLELAARALLCRGIVLEALGQHREALEAADKSMDIFTALNQPSGRAQSMAIVASIFHKMGDYENSLECYSWCMDRARETEDLVQLAALINNAAMVLYSAEKFAAAELRLHEALKIYDFLANDAARATVLHNLGAVEVRRKKYAAAKVYFNRARLFADRSNRIAIVSAVSVGLGRVAEEQELWAEAVQEYRKGIATQESVRSNLSEANLKLGLASAGLMPHARLVGCLLKLDKPEEAFAVLEESKARTLTEMLAGGRIEIRKGMTADERQRDDALLDELNLARVELEGVLNKKGKPPERAKAQERRWSAQIARDRYRRELYLRLPELQTRQAQFDPVTLAELGTTLFAADAKLVVASYLVGDTESYLFVLTSGERPGAAARLTVHRLKTTANTLADDCYAWWKVCSKPGIGTPQNPELHSLLISPLKQHLAKDSHLTIIPCASLYDLAFETLAEADEPYEISYAPSITALVRMAATAEKLRLARTGEASILAVGISDFGRRERSLPAAETEAQLAAQSFKTYGKSLLGPEATEAKVRSAWQNYRYLHFATHGRIDPGSPFDSSVVLSRANANDDGQLTARKLLDADVNAELVVLSACYTGAGKQVPGEGLLGLGWAWFVAGVPSQVVSLWQADDAATAEFMKAFYAKLSAGATKAEAIRHAKAVVKSNPKTSHPYYWAPFVLNGDWK